MTIISSPTSKSSTAQAFDKKMSLERLMRCSVFTGITPPQFAKMCKISASQEACEQVERGMSRLAVLVAHIAPKPFERSVADVLMRFVEDKFAELLKVIVMSHR